MEFLAGVIVTLFVEFIGWKIYKLRELKKNRATYIPPGGSRPIKGESRNTDIR